MPDAAGDAVADDGEPLVGEEALQARVAELEQQLEEANAKNGELEAKVTELQEQLDDEGARAPVAEPARSGETRKVTYLGRPQLVARDADGEPTEADIYHGTDPWGEGDVSLNVGESATVSAEKAEQLAADHGDAFEID